MRTSTAPRERVIPDAVALDVVGQIAAAEVLN
jgi:hypothetical protein